MTLDAIRARDAEWGSLDRPGAGLTFAPTPQVVRDRRTLLAEVDRLKADYADLLVERIKVSAAVERIERARISEAVRGLPQFDYEVYGVNATRRTLLDRAAVLAIVEGREEVKS